MTDRGVAIVTGGASGIGLAIAKALLGDGWKLVIADLASGPLEAARAELEPVRANATKCVVINEASVIAGLDGCGTGFGPASPAMSRSSTPASNSSARCSTST